MKSLVRFVLLSALLIGNSVALPAAAATILTVGSGFRSPFGLALDAAGNLFVVDQDAGAIFEVPAGDSLTPQKLPAGGFTEPFGLAIDAARNLYVADTGSNAVFEVMAAGGYATVRTLGSGFSRPSGVAVDAQGDVFVADSDNGVVKELLAVEGSIPASPVIKTLAGSFDFLADVALDDKGNLFAGSGDGTVKELAAASGYTTVATIGVQFTEVDGLALDSSGNVFVVDGQNNNIYEIFAAGGYKTVEILIDNSDGFMEPSRAAVDGSGNLFISDNDDAAVKEILATSPVLAASVLPGARSVQPDTPATFFATMINTSAAALPDCRIGLPGSAPSGLVLGYQTTDPITNMPTGTPNTPVTIAGSGGSQSFVVSLDSTGTVGPLTQPLAFSCDGVPDAAVVQGLDTFDLTVASTPTADIIAAAVTPTQDGVVDLPVGSSIGEASFAIASVNVGATLPITVSADTGDASLFIENLLLCQTNPATGQCLAVPASRVSLDFTSGSTPTFSVFVESFGNPIAFLPASSRIFVRFSDAAGNTHGSTSVAIRSVSTP